MASIGHLAGDILLLGAGGGKTANTAAQSLLRFRKTTFSHAAVMSDPVRVLHSMPSEGVHSVPVKELLSKYKMEDICVIRHRLLDSDPSKCQELREALFYFNKQKYNFGFALRIRENASFCSELAAKAYERIGIRFSSSKRPKQILPVDIEMLRDNPDWEDVTHLYADMCQDYERPNTFPSLNDLFTQTDGVLSDAGLALKEMEDTFQAIVKRQNEALRVLNQAEEIFGLGKTQIQHGRTYWDTKVGAGRKRISENARRLLGLAKNSLRSRRGR